MSMTNCINCGSAKDVHAKVCPFCGTSYFDLTDIDLSCDRRPCVVRFKYGENIFQMKAFLTLAELTVTPRYMDITSLNSARPMYLHGRDDVRANIEFVCCE